MYNFNMKLIVGLGNPGKEYDYTRHNIGFVVIDLLMKKLNLKISKEKFDGIFYKDKEKIIGVPLTYMNKSGDFIANLINFFKINIKDILVIHDDMDLNIGKFVFKKNGSDGGQNGIKSIIEKLGTKNFKRLKIGIGRPKRNAKNHVLGKFTNLESEKINLIKPILIEAIIEFLELDNFDELLKKYNGIGRGKHDINGN